MSEVKDLLFPDATITFIAEPLQTSRNAFAASPGVHNVIVIFTAVVLIFWIMRMMTLMRVQQDLKKRLQTGSRPVNLDGLSAFTPDLIRLSHAHFSQILRIRRTVPAQPVPKCQLSAHLLPEGLSLNCDENNARTLSMKIDATSACVVRVFWGVSRQAAADLLQTGNGEAGEVPIPIPETLLREGVGAYVEASGAIQVSTGSAQQVTVPVPDNVNIGFAQDPSLLPCMVAIDHGTGNGSQDKVPTAGAVFAEPQPPLHARWELSVLKFRVGSRAGTPDVSHQIVLTAEEPRQALELQGVYGFEDEGDHDCMVCYDRPKSVVLLNCRHCSVCQHCLRALREEKCPMCRSEFWSHLLVPLTGQQTDSSNGSSIRVDLTDSGEGDAGDQGGSGQGLPNAGTETGGGEDGNNAGTGESGNVAGSSSAICLEELASWRRPVWMPCAPESFLCVVRRSCFPFRVPLRGIFRFLGAERSHATGPKTNEYNVDVPQMTVSQLLYGMNVLDRPLRGSDRPLLRESEMVV